MTKTHIDQDVVDMAAIRKKDVVHVAEHVLHRGTWSPESPSAQSVEPTADGHSRVK